jgi:hypothetical protein
LAPDPARWPIWSFRPASGYFWSDSSQAPGSIDSAPSDPHLDRHHPRGAAVLGAGRVRDRRAAIEQLYAVAFIEACLASLFNSAYPAYVPSSSAPTAWSTPTASLRRARRSPIGGPGLAGTLVQIAGAPFAILVDAFSFVASAVSLALIRSSEAATTHARHDHTDRARDHRWSLGGASARIVFPLALRSILGHVFGSFYGVLLFAVPPAGTASRPFLLGIVISAGGVGSLVGSVFASRVIRALGIGPAIIWMALGSSALGCAHAAGTGSGPCSRR